MAKANNLKVVIPDIEKILEKKNTRCKYINLSKIKLKIPPSILEKTEKLIEKWDKKRLFIDDVLFATSKLYDMNLENEFIQKIKEGNKKLYSFYLKKLMSIEIRIQKNMERLKIAMESNDTNTISKCKYNILLLHEEFKDYTKNDYISDAFDETRISNTDTYYPEIVKESESKLNVFINFSKKITDSFPTELIPMNLLPLDYIVGEPNSPILASFNIVNIMINLDHNSLLFYYGFNYKQIINSDFTVRINAYTLPIRYSDPDPDLQLAYYLAKIPSIDYIFITATKTKNEEEESYKRIIRLIRDIHYDSKIPFWIFYLDTDSEDCTIAPTLDKSNGLNTYKESLVSLLDSRARTDKLYGCYFCAATGICAKTYLKLYYLFLHTNGD